MVQRMSIEKVRFSTEAKEKMDRVKKAREIVDGAARAYMRVARTDPQRRQEAKEDFEVADKLYMRALQDLGYTIEAEADIFGFEAF
jgi:hypothetical protein